jgi:Tol biopolymer transport system component
MGLFVMPVAQNVTNAPNPNDPAIQQKALQPYQRSSLILTQQYVNQPTWSPDGKQIAYLNYTNNHFDIWLSTVMVNPKTGAYTMKDSPVQLTDANGHLDADSRPFWTP